MGISGLAAGISLSGYYDRLLLDTTGMTRPLEGWYQTPLVNALYSSPYTGVKHCAVCGRTDREFAEKADVACRMCVVAAL